MISDKFQLKETKPEKIRKQKKPILKDDPILKIVLANGISKSQELIKFYYKDFVLS